MAIQSQNVLEEKKKKLAGKSIFFAAWGAANKNDSLYQNWYLPLKKMVKQAIVFDAGQEYFREGKEKMNKKFLKRVEEIKPDYIFFNLMYDEFELSTLKKLRKISPKTILVNIFSDDDWRFDNYSRYYSLFMDYALTCHDVRAEYARDGQQKAVFFMATNCEHFRPIDEKRIYDVVFFGKPNPSRIELMQLLIKKGIAFHLWGEGWERYPEFREYYHGYLPAEELVRVINQSKIVLGFTMGGYGKPQIKGRPFEVAACKSFILVEHYEKYLDFFRKEKEIVMFKDTEELIEKIQYYLKHEKEREEIAAAAYKKVIASHNQPKEIEKFLLGTLDKKPSQWELPPVQGRYAILSASDLAQPQKIIEDKLKGAEYVTFATDNTNHSLRYYFQAYALEKSGKEISCCDYYVSKPFLHNYLLFKSQVAFQKLSYHEFHNTLDISQLMVRKKYFLEHLDEVKNLHSANVLNKENTVFISIPLVTLHDFRAADRKVFESVFQMKFLDSLYSLYARRRIFISFYPYALLIHAAIRKTYIFGIIRNALKDAKKLSKLKEAH